MNDGGRLGAQDEVESDKGSDGNDNNNTLH